MIVEKTVLVFDICSSTVMMEDAQITSSLDSYSKMISDINDYLIDLQIEYSFEIYKFLGDGFILLFSKEVSQEKIYKFSEELVDVINKMINLFIEEHIQNQDISRIGITIGVDYGILDKFGNEYIGRAINLACRLQGKLDSVESINKMIVSKAVYSKYTDEAIRSLFVCKPKVLRNMNNGKEIQCYESNPMISIDGNPVVVKKGKKIGNIYYTPTIGTVIEKIPSKDKKGIQIIRHDGKIIYRNEINNKKINVDKLINNVNKSQNKIRYVGKSKKTPNN